MNVQEILNQSKVQLIACRREDTLETAATMLASANIGAMPVRDESDHLIGVISERDIVRALARHPSDMRKLTVSDIMTHDVATCTPEDDIKHVLEVMDRRRVRHLPVVDKGGLLGMISLRDTIRFRLNDAQAEINVLRDYAATRTSF